MFLTLPDSSDLSLSFIPFFQCRKSQKSPGCVFISHVTLFSAVCDPCFPTGLNGSGVVVFAPFLPSFCAQSYLGEYNAEKAWRKGKGYYYGNDQLYWPKVILFPLPNQKQELACVCFPIFGHVPRFPKRK